MGLPTSSIGIMSLGLRNLVYSRFGSILGASSLNTGCIYFPKEVAQREYAEKTDKNVVNFSSLWMENIQFSWERQRSSVGRHGMGLSVVDRNSTLSTTARAVPADMSFELTFWTTDLDTMNKLIEEFLFWVHESPTLFINLGGFPIEPYLKFKDISDSSTIKNMYNVGKYFVYSQKIQMEGWIPKFDTDWVIKEITLTGYTGTKDNKIQVFQDVITS